MSEPPPSGPLSGVVAPSIFRGDAGPGYWLREDSGVKVVFAELEGAPDSVLRLSPTGVWFTPERGREYPLDSAVELTLKCGDQEIGPLWGRIVAPPTAIENPILGVTFNEIPYRPARQILILLRELAAKGAARLAHRPPQVTEVIAEPGRVRSIMKALSSVGNRGRIETASGPSAVHLRELTEDGKLCWSDDARWTDGPCVVDMVGYNSVYRLRLPDARRVGDHIETPLPTSVERTRNRQHRRGEARSRLRVSFHHPLWARLPLIARELREVSFGGLSFTTTLDTDMLFPGLVLPLIEVRGEGGEFARLRGEVRAISTIDGEEVVGVSVQPLATRDEPRWHRLIAEILYPTTDDGEQWTTPVWDLFERSGYFNLSGKAPEQFVAMRESFESVASHTGNGVLGRVVFPSDRGVEATFSLAKAYSGAWCGHQLAKLPGQPPAGVQPHQILRDLYVRVFEYPQRDPDFRWFMGYLEASIPWNKRVQFAFSDRFASTGLTGAFPFRLMECSCSGTISTSINDVEIGRATEHELHLLVKVIARDFPALYADVLDLNGPKLDLDGVSRQWSNAELERERRIIVARRDNIPVAAAVVELSERGTNLFRLLDGVRLFALAPGGREAFPHLLDESRRWFRSRQRDAFVYFMEEEDLQLVEAASLTDLGEGMLWILGAPLIPDFLEFVMEMTCPRREQRRTG